MDATDVVCLLTKTLAGFLISEMHKEGIQIDYYDEDEILTPDVRDMMEMEVQRCIYFGFQILDTYIALLDIKLCCLEFCIILKCYCNC